MARDGRRPVGLKQDFSGMIKKKVHLFLCRQYEGSVEVAERSLGADAMRSVLALGLLIALCTSANAARVHHSKPRYEIFRHSHAMIPRFVAGPTRYDDIPSYNDPSKFGGGAP
jgi:hypothetical protein